MEKQLDILEAALEPEMANGGVAFEVSEEERRDLEKVKAFIAGDDSAFLDLYARFEAPLLHYCLKMSPDHRVAEDAFQETWTKVFELRAKQGLVTRFQPLLFRMARNICLNSMRGERVRHKNTVDAETVEIGAPADTTQEDEELRSLLSTALGKLPVDQREVFILHEYCNFTYEQIAAMLGRTLTNVKTTAFRSRMRLRQLVASWLGLGEEDDPMGRLMNKPKHF
jgi:RNA polymerase sigma-70 factor (ECF subfamily)